MEVRANGFDETLDGWVRAALVRGARKRPVVGQHVRLETKQVYELVAVWDRLGMESRDDKKQKPEPEPEARARSLNQIGQRLLDEGWAGDDLAGFVLTELGAILTDDPRLSADHLGRLLAAKGKSLGDAK